MSKRVIETQKMMTEESKVTTMVTLPTTSEKMPEKSKCDTMSYLLPVANQLNTDYERFSQLESEATFLMLRIGIMLEYVKEQLPHGQLQKWREENLIIDKRHAQRFQQLAKVFLVQKQIESKEQFLLADPSDPAYLKVKQLAVEFLGDKSQAELFEEYGIKSPNEKKKREYYPPHPKEELPEGETWEHISARNDWTEILEPLDRHAHKKTWANLRREEIEGVFNIISALYFDLKKALK